MQIRTLSIILTMVFAAAFHANGAESTRENFLRITGLKLGEVELVEGSADCRFSTLGLIEIGDGSISLMAGANPLITGLGIKPERYKERGCEMTEAAVYKDRSATFRKIQDCSGKVFGYNVSVTALDNGFSYRRLNTQDGRLVLDQPCKFRYVKEKN